VNLDCAGDGAFGDSQDGVSSTAEGEGGDYVAEHRLGGGGTDQVDSAKMDLTAGHGGQGRYFVEVRSGFGREEGHEDLKQG